MKLISEARKNVKSKPRTRVVNRVAAALGVQSRLKRHFDPETGRWSNQEPMNFEASEADQLRYVETLWELPELTIAPLLSQVGEAGNGDERIVYSYDAEGRCVSRSSDAANGNPSECSDRYRWTGRVCRAKF